MMSAKIVMKVNQSILATFREANNAVSLRMCFKDQDKSVPVSFFITSKITGFNPYSQADTNLQIITISFTNQPPEDFVSTIGLLIEANTNAKNRAEDRILLTPDAIKSLGLIPKKATLVVTGIPRACILRDLSFTGSKIIISGIGKFLVNKPAILNFEMEDLPPFSISGTILRYDEVEGRKDLSTLGFKFDEKLIPIEYKMRVNEYLVKKQKPIP
ncbi:MAG: PilZ domain-containing protein [Spirochaetales bacterium]|nr:PilZ domain-containing protein [Spirochaetales bacterium]